MADGKGILAADETVGTLTKRLEKLRIRSTAESRRDYRELLFTVSGSADFIAGVIMFDETIRQHSSDGVPFPTLLSKNGILPGIKVDIGATPLAGSDGETITEGLDGLRHRLKEYRSMGARFAKWRAVIRIADRLPSRMAISGNAHALARYAGLCQEQGLVPIVEPEVLMEGNHAIDRCSEITGQVLHAVFDALHEQRVLLEGLLLKPNMIMPGAACPKQSSSADVAEATLRCLLRHVPAAVPGVVFLSGGQSDVAATVHLNDINTRAIATPWKVSFSYGRALQDMALATWLGNRSNVRAAQQAFLHRAKCNSAASLGKYTTEMEQQYTGNTSRERGADFEDD